MKKIYVINILFLLLLFIGGCFLFSNNSKTKTKIEKELKDNIVTKIENNTENRKSKQKELINYFKNTSWVDIEAQNGGLFFEENFELKTINSPFGDFNGTWKINDKNFMVISFNYQGEDEKIIWKILERSDKMFTALLLQPAFDESIFYNFQKI